MKASTGTKANRKRMYDNLTKQGMPSKQAFRTVGKRFPVVRGKGDRVTLKIGGRTVR